MVTPLHEIAFRFVLAIALVAAMGLERKSKGRPAGLGTYVLISLAAAVFTLLAYEIGEEARGRGDGMQVDPVRAIEAVTAGVAFLAAGSIIQARGQVHGLTTGAGMWMAGAIGVACGSGNYAIAVMAAVLAFLVLVLGKRLEKLLWGEDVDETPLKDQE